MYDVFLSRRVESARFRAIFDYCDWCILHPGVKGGLPDFGESGIELIDGKPHAIVRTIGGKALATYQILTDGELRRCN